MTDERDEGGKMRAVKDRFEELEFEVLKLAVEKGEVRFKDALQLALACCAPISTKTVSKLLRRMVNMGCLEKVRSEATKRSAYKISTRGVEEYRLRWIIKEFRNGSVQAGKIIGIEDEETSTENLIGRFEMVVKELQTFFLCFLPRIREIGYKQHREKALTMIADFSGKLFTELCMDSGRPLLYREDADEKIATRFEAIYSEYEAVKEKFFRRRPEGAQKILDIVREADEAMKRLRDRLKAYRQTS